jgi:3-oxoacyl-[acyl-carrier-protein] synthase-3
MFQTIITGTGCYVPTQIKTNRDFTVHDFYDEAHQRITTPPLEVVQKFRDITGIEERRYAEPGMNTSDMAIIAARIAIEDSGIDPETLDQIIVAHNFGNVIEHTIQTDAVPSLANRVKHGLGIKNPSCVAFDLLFGCPGWIQGVIQINAFFKSGLAKKALVIGAETLSRVVDKYDRDSMIFSDGAGATVLECIETTDSNAPGILSFSAQSHSTEEANYLNLGKSNFPGSDPRIRFIKMKGRKIYEYSMIHVPAAMKDCLDKSGVDISEVKKVFIHQANEKMDEAIIKRFYQLYNQPVPHNIMPMNIHLLGNSSVATVPTLFDMVRKGMRQGHELNSGDVLLFASVGAGMNINALCYRMP